MTQASMAIEELESSQYNDELDEKLESIADSLAYLSTIEEIPEGHRLQSDPFEADEVDFKKQSWLLRLAQVQDWLRLDEALTREDFNDDPTKALDGFFRLICDVDPEQCYKIENEAMLLTIEGADAIAARLENATTFANRFVEAIEDLPLDQATAEWESSWEEEEDYGQSYPEPIVAVTAEWPIMEVADEAVENRLNLNPSYQRADVWPKKTSQKLIESILRGIPLPSIILLEPSRADHASVVCEVVDGKQRLTAILRFIGKHPAALERVKKADEEHPDLDFMSLFENDYRKFKKLWRLHMGESLKDANEKEYYFPFSLSKDAIGLQGELAPLAGKYFYEIRDEEVRICAIKETVKKLFGGVSKYKIPLIKYMDAKPRQIHDVFRLYNQQGMKLNAEEIRNAVFHDLDLIKLLLVAAGDNSTTENLINFIDPQRRAEVAAISTFLDDYKFGTSRYKRTKILSWLVSILISPSVADDGALKILSTKGQVNALLHAIRESSDDDPHILKDCAGLQKLVSDLHQCIKVHSECDGWANKFRDNGDGVKWQELQLIASLVGVFLICLVRDDADELLEERCDDLREFTENHPRPRKAQNRTQWGYIGEVSLGMVELMEIDLGSVEQAMNDRYRVTCIPTLQAARMLYESGA